MNSHFNSWYEESRESTSTSTDGTEAGSSASSSSTTSTAPGKQHDSNVRNSWGPWVVNHSPWRERVKLIICWRTQIPSTFCKTQIADCRSSIYTCLTCTCSTCLTVLLSLICSSQINLCVSYHRATRVLFWSWEEPLLPPVAGTQQLQPLDQWNAPGKGTRAKEVCYAFRGRTT